MGLGGGKSGVIGWRRVFGGRSLAVLAVLAALEPGHAFAQAAQALPASDAIRARVLARGEGGEPGALRFPEAVVRFYEARGFRPAWTSATGRLPAAEGLAAAVAEAPDHGLRTEDYPLVASSSGGTGVPSPRQPDSQAGLDLALTDTFFALAEHLSRGRPDAAEVSRSADRAGEPTDLEVYLEKALEGGRIREALSGLAPSDSEYLGLQASLARYRDIACSGGWEALPRSPTLHEGDRSPAVLALRRRLFAEGYLPAPGRSDRLDHTLELAVRNYQEKNGLEPDGLVGKDTRQALDVSASARVSQIEANLERRRRLPRRPEKRYLRVNVAAFTLEAVERGRVVWSTAVVVGTGENPTPSLSSRITHLVLNPVWNVPPQIASEELLPEVQRDPSYLAEKGFRVLRGWEPEPQPVDPATVDWATVSLDREGLHFQQGPGPQNALGRLKFLFSNPFHVYLHDTPARGLFAKTRRDFSHGCIRVAEPLKLADYLLAGDPRWSPEALREALDRGEERTLPLREPLPLYVEYVTAWADDGGAVHFRPDIYSRDRQLLEGLRAPDVPRVTRGSASPAALGRAASDRDGSPSRT